MGNESVAGVAERSLPTSASTSRTPVSTTDIKLLGSYTTNIPAGGFTTGAMGTASTEHDPGLDLRVEPRRGLPALPPGCWRPPVGLLHLLTVT